MARQRTTDGTSAILVIGAIAAIAPLMIHATGAGTRTVHGVVIEGSFRDWAALGCGTVAAGCGMAAMIGARTQASGWRFAIAVLIALIGAYHIARGMGLVG